MSPPFPTREQFLQLARRHINGMSAATRNTLVAELQQEINNREEVQEELDDVRRQTYALSDLLNDYEELLPQLEAQNQAYVEEIQESREEIRKGKQREDATEEYSRLLETRCEGLENESTRAAMGSAVREKDLRMELDAENLRAQELEEELLLQDGRARQIDQWLTQKLRAEYKENEALGQHTTETEESISRLTHSQAQSRHNANRMQETSSRLAHQGEYNLADRSFRRKAKPRKRRRRCNKADSGNCMEDCIQSAELMDVEDVVDVEDIIEVEDVMEAEDAMEVEDLMDVEDAEEVVMQGPPPPMTEYMKIQEILKLLHERRKPRGVRRRAYLKRRNESAVRQTNLTWNQYRNASAGLGTDSSDSEGDQFFPIPPRKKRTRGLNLDEEINQSPKRRRFSAEAPELPPKMQRLAIDEIKVTTPSQSGPIRIIRSRVSQCFPLKGVLTKKRRGPQPPSLTSIRESDLLPLLVAAEQRQRLDRRGRSLSLNDLPELPAGQMPGMWPSDALDDIDLVSQCQRVWRELLDWFLQILWKQPSMVLFSVGLAVLAWVWHGHRVQEDWMTANEIPYGIAAELRNARVSEIRWVESLVFSLTKWLDVDRSMLG